MYFFKKCLFLVLAFCLLFTLLPEGASGWWRKKRRPKPKVNIPKPRAKRRAKVYKYIQRHDYNNDGVVDTKDRLLWLRRKKGIYLDVLVIGSNEDIFEVMDGNEDGKVDAQEMEYFYKEYDLNKNGVLEDREIDAATD